MAVKWAVANGNWNAGATWNGGSVPVDGDIIYANGHTVTLNVNVNLINSELRNDECPSTLLSGGSFTYNWAQNRTIICKKYVCGNSDLLIQWHNGCTVTGDIYLEGSGTFICSAGSNQSRNFTINGNVYCNNITSVLLNDITYSGNTLIINGNVISSVSTNANLVRDRAILTINGNVVWNGSLATNTITTKLTIVGNAHICNNKTRCTDATIGGSLRIDYTHLYVSGVCELGGIVEYKSTTNSPGLLANQIVITNPSTFTWKDITEPRSNSFIIVTNADMNNRQQYPPEDEVKEGTEYVWGEKVGTYTPNYPPESVVLKDYEYGDSDDRKTGTMVQEVNVEVGCVTPEDVRKDVPLVGMGVVGSLVVPSADDVREGVVFDNGSVGTLIVQGGGDRLRIADFGYYTNAQSDTYIVDLTEQDKPKFAVAEERVLIEMFPDLDLDNIPDKYFDDLFVKYLKYRLIVEYYRTAGINSTFTPSEPTTEIVNYQNVRNEVWLNSANIYLKAWSKKYPESIVKPQRILL